ncbi:MAG: 4-oxalocrotonate tautomerase [Pseudomonadota bacterium]
MPVYTVASRAPLNYETRQQAAKSITEIHCAVTGAPPEFVNIVFMEGHRIKEGKELGVIGTVRKGGNRNKELTDSLRQQIHDGVAAATGLARQQMATKLIGFPASWAMEGGEILPEPGEEGAWLKRSEVA